MHGCFNHLHAIYSSPMQRPKFSLDSFPSTAISSNLFSTWCHPSPVVFWSRKRKLWRPLLVLDPVKVILRVDAGLLALLNTRPTIEGRRRPNVTTASGTFGRDSQTSRKWLKGVIGTFNSRWSSCSFIGILHPVIAPMAQEPRGDEREEHMLKKMNTYQSMVERLIN